MCDRCGQIFSERSKGWQTFRGITVDSADVTVTVTMDACPNCAIPINQGSMVQPRLSSGNDETPPFEETTNG